MKPTAGVFSRGRRSFLVQKPEAPRGPAASLCPTAMFLSFALNALSRDNIVAVPCQHPPPPPTMTVSMKVSWLLAQLKALAPLHLRV